MRPGVDRVDLAEPGDVPVEDGDVRAHADRDLRGVLAGDAAADDDDIARAGAGDAAEQRAVTAALAHQVVGADLRGEAAGDLGHRGEQRQAAVGQLHRLVGDAGDLVAEEGVGAGLVGGQVQVGEQRQAGAHAVVLLRDRLLDLEHHVGDAPHFVRVWDDGGAGGDVGVVGKLRADARVLLKEDLVAVVHQLAHARGRDGDAVLVVLDLAGDAYLHGVSAFRSWRRTLFVH